MSHRSDVSRYYDFLYLWSQVSSRFRAFSRADAHTIHRPLTHPDTGEVRADVINDLIAAQWRSHGPPDPPEALDAGCGYGGTALELQRVLGGHFRGITINRTQIRVAQRSANARGVAAHTRFVYGSYDDPQPCAFNLIYAIESMVHSGDPARTIANLSAALLPGGLLIIVDDMPVKAVPERFSQDLARFKVGWRCPVLPTAEEWRAMIEANGLTLVADRDLNPLLVHNAEEDWAKSLAYSERKQRMRKALGLGMVSDAQIGGLMLERLLRENIILYRMLVARRP